MCEILDETEVYFGVYVKKRDIWGRLCEMPASSVPSGVEHRSKKTQQNKKNKNKF